MTDQRLTDRLAALAAAGGITPEALVSVIVLVDEEVDGWRSRTAAELKRMAREWEATMGDDDRTLYSLGLRRAIDVVTGIVPTDIPGDG